MRAGLKALLAAESDFTIVGEAADGVEAVRRIDEHAPDVVLLDLVLPKLSGFEVIRHLEATGSRSRALVLSMHANEGYVVQALRHGAAGYLLKASSTDELASAVRTVAAGRRYLGAPFSDRAIEAYSSSLDEAELDPYETLTQREREVLQLAAEGVSNNTAARRLGISVRTIEVHRANLMRKLGLGSGADLIRYGLRRGLVSLDS